MALSADESRRTLAVIALWRADGEAEPACPRCGQAGLAVSDHSARPHAEWYHLSCPGCGLDETLHIPLAPPAGDRD